jgi:hypothetical protein
MPMTANTDWRAPVGFDTPADELRRRLSRLYAREGRLFNAGVTCPVKDSPETSCHACPFSKEDKPEEERCGLCRVGLEQERIQTLLIAQGAAARKASG